MVVVVVLVVVGTHEPHRTGHVSLTSAPLKEIPHCAVDSSVHWLGSRLPLHRSRVVVVVAELMLVLVEVEELVTVLDEVEVVVSVLVVVSVEDEDVVKDEMLVVVLTLVLVVEEMLVVVPDELDVVVRVLMVVPVEDEDVVLV